MFQKLKCKNFKTLKIKVSNLINTFFLKRGETIGMRLILDPVCLHNSFKDAFIYVDIIF